MIDLNLAQKVAVSNQQSLKRLQRAISMSQGQFSLILVCCNHPSLRDQVSHHIADLFSGKIQQLFLHPYLNKLYTTIQITVKDQQPQALMVFGLECVENVEEMLVATNLVRHQFRICFPFPLVLWVNDEIMRKIVRLAPDFKNWAAPTIRFSVSPNYAESDSLNCKSA